MPDRKIFISKVSFEDAKRRAWDAGYRPVSYARNARHEFVCFGQRFSML